MLDKTARVWSPSAAKVAQPPDDAVVLASSGVCGCQAMRVGNRAWSMQYHVEIEADTIAEWGKVPAYAEALERTHGAGALDRMAAAAAPYMQSFEENAQTLYRNFMQQVRG